MKKLLWLPLAAAALSSVPAAAQRTIVPGEITRGTLSNGDPTMDGSYYHDYAFEARRGETVVLLMDSDAFDSYLRLGMERRSGGWRELAHDDDGGNGRDARLEFVIPEDGRYVVRASSFRGRSTGAYTLVLAGGRASGGYGYDPDPPPLRRRNGRGDGTVRAGERIDERLSSADRRLDNGEPFHLYEYDGQAGERIRISLRSTDFDAYLVLGTPGGRHGVGNVLVRNDDDGGDRDAYIEHTLPKDGVYVIRVNPFASGRGEYTLEVDSDLRDEDVYYGGGEYDEADDYDQADASDGEVDWRLIGEWAITEPAAGVQTGDWSSVSARAALGILSIDESGTYTWRR
ncbi:MAG TPA: hypothetical protein VM759_00120, partial [Longimicrobium sp.]|nr:hypothetical protein [Longimicrobium sp.]